MKRYTSFAYIAIVASLLVLSLGLHAGSAYGEESQYAKLSYNQDAVAVLAKTTFNVQLNSNGTATITTPATNWSRAAMKTKRSYIVFSKSGVRLAADNPQLGSAPVESDDTQYVLKTGTAKLVSGGKSVAFTGTVVAASDLATLFKADGPVGGSVSDADLRAALAESMQGTDDVAVAVVDMPELNSQTASAWVKGLSGKLSMVRFDPKQASQAQGSSGSSASSATAVSDTLSIAFNRSKYKGLYLDIKPFNDSESPTYSDFLQQQFRNGWMVDGDGFLWYVDANGIPYFFEDSFYTVAEHAFNSNAVSDISQQGRQMANALRAPASPLAIEGVELQPNIAFGYKGFKATGYCSLSIEDVLLSLDDMTLTHTESSGLHYVASYGSARDFKMYFNACLNKGFPVRVQAGPVAMSLRFSWGMELDAVDFACSIDVYQKSTTQIDLTTGESVVLGREHDENGSFSFGANGTMSLFISMAIGVGPLGEIASLDICPVALSVRAFASYSDGSSIPANTCGELAVDVSGYLRIPSIYDRGIGGRPSENPFEDNIFTALGWVLKDAHFQVDLYRVNLFSSHIENGKRVNRCTRGAGFDDGSRVITQEMCSFAKWQDLVVKPGSGYHPRVVVKKIGYGANDTLVEKTDYTVAYNDFARAGVGVATVQGKGKWSGKVLLEYTVERTDISHETLAAEYASYTYTGSAIKPKAIKRAGKLLKEDADYRVVKCASNVDVGTGTMLIRGIGFYTGSARVVFSIDPASIKAAAISGVSDKTYTGKAIVQKPVLKLGGRTLDSSRDYTVEYRSNTNAGVATIVFTGKGNYTGSTFKRFNIARATIPLPPAGKKLVYNGQKQAGYTTCDPAKPTYGIKGGTIFATTVGNYTSIAQSNPNYIFSDSTTQTNINWSISAAPISSVEVAAVADQTYTGKAITPAPALKLGGTALKADGTYKVAYRNNVNAGTATITYTGA